MSFSWERCAPCPWMSCKDGVYYCKLDKNYVCGEQPIK